MKKIYTLFLVSVLFLFFVIASAEKGEAAWSASQATPVYNVVPTAYTNVPGNLTFLGPLANSQRTYQLLINQDQLTELIGRNLSGVSFRRAVSAAGNWPLSPAVYTNYDIYLSRSVAPADRSLTDFSSNAIGTQIQVRSGVLTIDTSSYTSGNSPNQFGTEITFLTPYLYTGGHLLVEIRHTGFTGTSSSVDAIGTAVGGYGTQFSACWSSSYTGNSGSQGNFAVTRITADSTIIVGVNEPGGMIPAEFQLSQNYPNPFNPVTKLEFGISNLGFVSLKVYDALGKEIKTLVNEVKSPGTYRVDFDGSGFSSGLYYYKLTAGEYIETKRMTLLK